MLKLDVVDTGVVEFKLPPHIGRLEVDDFNRAIKLLGEGGCKGVIVDFDAVTSMRADALHRMEQCAIAAMRGSPLRLVFRAAARTPGSRILRRSRLVQYSSRSLLTNL